MSKIVFPPMRQVVEDMDSLTRDLRSIKTILCCIAYQQEDKILQVPFDALADMPKGIELEIGVDPIHKNYTFKCIIPNVPDENTAGKGS